MKNDGNIFGISKEEIKRQCSTKSLEGDLTQAPIVEGETLEPCLRGAKKIVEDSETLEMVRAILTNCGLVKDKVEDEASENFHITPIPFTEGDKTLEEITLEYGIQDDEIILRLWEIKQAIKDKKQKKLSNDELISFLRCAMNYDDMQIWLMEKQIEGIELPLNDKLKKFFELKSNEDIVRLYDIEQNYNQNNMDGIKKFLKKCNG